MPDLAHDLRIEVDSAAKITRIEGTEAGLSWLATVVNRARREGISAARPLSGDLIVRRTDIILGVSGSDAAAQDA